MKKLSLFSLFGLAGLLAFVVMPTYAQEIDETEDTNIIAEAEDVDVNAEDEFNYGADEEDVALESVNDEITIEENVDIDGLNVVEDVDDSINDIIGFLDDGENLDVEDSDASSFELKIGDRIIHINPLTFFLSGIGLAILSGLIIWLILCHVSLWRIFGRAGEGKWKSLIPFYNLYIVFKIAGIKNWFRYMILVVLIAGIISGIFPAYETMLDDFSTSFSGTVTLIVGFLLTKKFGRGNNGSILYTLFSMIGILVLGLGNYKYQGKSEEKIIEA